MRGNTFGKMISMTTFGESHGKAMGLILDGVPSNLLFCLEDLKKELKRRAPGQILGTTSRKEDDEPEILSGIFNDRTLGTPICIIIKNSDQKSSDYDSLKDEFRPGHADQTTLLKYGIRDHRGGGRASGRETLCRVIAGYFAGLIIPELKVKAYNTQMGKFSNDILLENLNQDLSPYHYSDPTKNKEIETYLLSLKESGDSVGGQVRLIIDDCPKGLGEPVFHKLKSDLAGALMSIGACTSFSYGLGEKFSELLGSEATLKRNNFGGMEGGISNGERIIINLTFRAPSTVGEKAKLGRHDPCLLPRVIPVVEAMAKFVIADHFLRQKAYEI
jgi:chorismate synthase